MQPSTYTLESAPDSLTQPSSSFKKHIWLATGGLLTFVALYIALSGWFALTAYRLVMSAFQGADNGFLQFLSLSHQWNEQTMYL